MLRSGTKSDLVRCLVAEKGGQDEVIVDCVILDGAARPSLGCVCRTLIEVICTSETR